MSRCILLDLVYRRLDEKTNSIVFEGCSL